MLYIHVLFFVNESGNAETNAERIGEVVETTYSGYGSCCVFEWKVLKLCFMCTSSPTQAFTRGPQFPDVLSLTQQHTRLWV